MLYYGYIITRGKRAVAIQTKEGSQYYALLEDVAPLVLEETWTTVCFRVDRTKWEGRTHSGPRYHAYDVDFVHF